MIKTFLLSWTIVFLCSVFAESYAASLYDKMDNGNTFFEQEKFEEALNTFVDAQIEYPEDSNLKYNIASVHYKMKNYDEAVKGFFDVAAGAQDVQLEERALYNIGNAKYRQGKLEEAVEYYKKALELDAEDKDALQNLEFVREEIKRRVNESKKTAQQQQQKQEDKGQCRPGENRPQEQSGEGQQNRQENAKAEQRQEQGVEKEEQPQAGGAEESDKEEQQAEPSQAYAREMTREEAEQWLKSAQEDRGKFKRRNQEMKGKAPYRSGKDW